MAVTRLKRKEQRNRTKANNRINAIKQLTQKPIIKNVDIEAIKQEFASKAAQAKTEATPKAEKTQPAAEAQPATRTAEAPAAEATPAPKTQPTAQAEPTAPEAEDTQA